MSGIKQMIKKFIPSFILSKRQDLLLNKQREEFRRGCLELLYLVDDILKAEKIPYWLNYGTLLGVYRDNDFIPHDYDLDIGLMKQYQQRVKSLLLEKGLTQVFEAHMGGSWENPEIVEYRFKNNGACIDFNFYTEQNNNVHTYDFVPIEGIDYSPNPKKRQPVMVEGIVSPFTGIAPVIFKGRQFYVPENTEDYIVANYGPSWRIPVKDWDYHDYAENIKTYKRGEVFGEVIIFN